MTLINVSNKVLWFYGANKQNKNENIVAFVERNCLLFFFFFCVFLQQNILCIFKGTLITNEIHFCHTYHHYFCYKENKKKQKHIRSIAFTSELEFTLSAIIMLVKFNILLKNEYGNYMGRSSVQYCPYAMLLHECYD